MGEWDPVMYAWRKKIALRLRHLERVPLGTPYTEVVDRVVAVTRSGELAGRCHLIADATGVGRPVMDMLRRAELGFSRLWPVEITSGTLERYADGHYRVPKRDLIVGLQLLLQRRELQIAKGMVGRRSGVLFVITLFRKLSREICPLTGYTTACFVRNVIFDIATIARKLSLNAMHLGRRLAGTKAVAAARACSVLAGNALDCGPAARCGRRRQRACSVVG